MHSKSTYYLNEEISMEAKFKLEDLKRKIDEMIQDGIQTVDLSFYEKDEIDDEIVAATLEFYGYNGEGEEFDYGGIEEIE